MDHTLALIMKSQQGDKEARDTVFKENAGLVYSMAKRFAGRSVEMEDIVQIGSIGLLKAIDRFDISYDVKFSTYAVPMIIGEIRRYLRDDGMLKVSRNLKENCARIYSAREALCTFTVPSGPPVQSSPFSAIASHIQSTPPVSTDVKYTSPLEASFNSSPSFV